MDWKARLKNKTFLITFLIALISLIYNILGLVGVVPSISQDNMREIIITVVNFLALLGIVVDPTTHGISDGKKVLDKE